MNIKFIKRNIFQRILGLAQTKSPGLAECWYYDKGKLVINLQKVPELQKPGGAVRLEGKNLPVRVLVVLSEDEIYRAYCNQCTHLGHRRLDPVPGTNTVQCCSVNKSTFDSDGKTIFGPAPHPIHCYPIEKVEEKLIATVSK